MSQPPASTLRVRLQAAFSTGAMWTAGLAGAAGLLAPALVVGTSWPPLQARCMAVTALSLALALAAARRTLDPAALHLPLLALGGWLLPAAALLAASGDGGRLVQVLLTAMGMAALALARTDGDTPAPAQHRHRTWTAVAGLALALALALLAMPRAMAPHWPWRLDAARVVQYAPMFGAWGVVLWRLARERRRYVRLPVLWGLGTWAAGVLGSSLWHAAAFREGSLSTWLWFGAWAALAALAAHGARPVGGWRVRARLGPRPRDTGTGWRGH